MRVKQGKCARCQMGRAQEHKVPAASRVGIHELTGGLCSIPMRHAKARRTPTTSLSKASPNTASPKNRSFAVRGDRNPSRPDALRPAFLFVKERCIGACC